MFLRCNMRKCSRRAGQDAILPCSFPPRPESVLVDVPHNFLQLTAEAWEDVGFSPHVRVHVLMICTTRSTPFCSMLSIFNLSVSHAHAVVQPGQICYTIAGMRS
jgi:hypothetical protein